MYYANFKERVMRMNSTCQVTGAGVQGLVITTTATICDGQKNHQLAVETFLVSSNSLHSQNKLK